MTNSASSHDASFTSLNNHDTSPDSRLTKTGGGSQKLTSFEFLSVLDSLAEAIVIVGTDYTIRFANKAICNLFNIKPIELTGKRCWKVFECPFFNTPKCNMVKVVEGKKTEPFEIERLNTKQLPTPYLFSVHPLFSKSGKLVGLVESYKDMTRRKKLQLQLNEAEELYKSFVELSSEIDGSVVLVQDTYDSEGVIIFSNQQFSRITGYTMEELTGKCFFDLISEEARDISLDRHRRKMRGEILPGLYEISILAKKGELIPFELTSATSQYKGQTTNVIYMRDISQRKKMQQALIKERDLSRKYLDTANVIIIALDADGIVTLINRKGCQILEGKKSEILGKNWITDFIPPEFRTETANLLHKIIKGRLSQAAYNENSIITIKGNKRIIAWHNSVIRDDENNIIAILGSGEDVTELRQAETKLKQYQEELENLVEQRTASLNEQIERRIEFTRALVHELKTPVTAIMSSSEILSEKISDKLLLGFINNISKSSSTLNNRVDELLDMAKSEIGVLNVSRKKISPVTLLQCTIEEMNPLANKKGQTIFLEMLEPLPNIYGDFERLNQVLLNLIDNAIKFNRRSGSIKVSARKQDALIVFGVSDQGKGITNGGSEKIFVPYYRLPRDRERSNGLGLGLALAKSLVELHDGNMWVKNNIDNGCTFYFSIPVNKLAEKEGLGME